VIQDPRLREQRGLIPIEMLVGHFAVLNPDYAGDNELGFSACGVAAMEVSIPYRSNA
jgi:hypothetical protein